MLTDSYKHRRLMVEYLNNPRNVNTRRATVRVTHQKQSWGNRRTPRFEAECAGQVNGSTTTLQTCAEPCIHRAR